MSIVSPFHDAGVAGCVANASLYAPAKTQAPAPCEAAFAPSSLCAQTQPQAAPRRRRRLFEAMFSLVSGPTMPNRA